MFHRDPVRSLSWALQCAMKQDLLPAGDRRPCEHECDVVLFGQVWSGAALGLRNADARLEQDTVVVVGPEQDACVYVSTTLAYHVFQPNRRFFLDVAAHQMAPKAEAGVYEGRDDPVTEAVDIEVGVMLARLHAEVQAGEPHRAALVASYLHRCAACFEAPQREAAPVLCTPVANETLRGH
ncbi:hypothetical protein [Methylibium rhizosphaerae]|uniref:hypothetical protein n=1 Tax=Methylibium rhizosphaerae TaxID=2570323 RepID=UPI00112B7D36|nr:hypothetical protein [Methylibium rhizosphaerae]